MSEARPVGLSDYRTEDYTPARAVLAFTSWTGSRSFSFEGSTRADGEYPVGIRIDLSKGVDLSIVRYNGISVMK